MINDNYNKAYTEIVEILKYVPNEDVDKIPSDMLSMFNEKKDTTYIFTIDATKPFAEQKLLVETEAILANIYRDYWATPYEKESILIKEAYDREQMEKQKREQYNPDDIFKKRTRNNITSNINEKVENNLIMDIQKQSFFRKLINLINK